MTPPAAATKDHAARPARGRTASRPPRRISGPARHSGGRRAEPPYAGSRGGAAAAAPPLALRLARAVGRIGDARVLDRLVRGRAWIALVAVGLLGIVFMQVSMLRLNAGISRAITSAETLHRQNAALRADISELGSGDRIHDAAGALGMVMPAAGSVNFLDARKADAREAARAIRPPKPVAKTAGAGAGTTTQPAHAPGAQAQATAAAAAGATMPPQGAATQAAAPSPAQQAPATTAATPQQAPATTTTTPQAAEQAPAAQQAPAATTTPAAPPAQQAPATTSAAQQQAPTTTAATPPAQQGPPATTTSAAPPAATAPQQQAGPEGAQ
jgi:hypothetical protein